MPSFKNASSTQAMLLTAALLATTCAAASDYDPVPPQVSYAAVAGLEVAAPTRTVFYGPDALQYAELWLPEQAESGQTAPAPVIAFIHGGCWLNAYDIAHTRPFAAALSAAGYAVWSIEYRRTGDAGGGWPGSYQDIQAALRALSEQQMDLSRLAIMGHSAGGHLALLAAAEAPADLDVDAVIGLAAITDLPAYANGDNSCERATASFMGGEPEAIPERYQQANPAARPVHVQTVLIQGTADRIVAASQADLADATTIWVQDAGHFDMIHPGAPAWAQIIDTLKIALPGEPDQ